MQIQSIQAANVEAHAEGLDQLADYLDWQHLDKGASSSSSNTARRRPGGKEP